MTDTILHINASARRQGSVTRNLTAKVVAGHPNARVITRDLAEAPLPQLTEDWVAANFTPADARTKAQNDTLALSDTLVAELQAADTLVIGLPVYNFGVPAALKAWVDLIGRAGVTFRYTENGPEGLLTGKRAIVALASGGTEADSAIDFATPYIKHVLGFMGITDVTVVAADQMAQNAEASLEKATAQIAELARAA
ncbi:MULTISPECIES: FMN-dependent NADH-azoreductase [Sediminimonas]|uniref:FMN-dependent NADH-azoreductase n=1 Tax=Sediminimonas TaxID=659427 RepID=UPI000413A53D|nr:MULTISPECIES: NAD(P)H-dependent oxidoreductase [Sediminimonas]MDR9485678.1 NAD(P)H-dependent oxidoreductase [Sediminimonas sp.]